MTVETVAHDDDVDDDELNGDKDQDEWATIMKNNK